MEQAKGFDQAMFAARQGGAEACANHRCIYPDSEGRFDLAFYYGVEKWFDIPEEQRNALTAEYAKGWRTEKSLQ